MDRARRMVRDCGKLFRDQPSIAGLTTALTPEEEKSPFAPYYHRGVKPLNEEQARAFAPGKPMDPKDAFLPGDYAAHMCKPGYNRVENGYCVLPDGVGYVAVLTPQEGISDEMIRHFNAHFAPDPDLFYKIWCPGSHLRHMADGAIEDVGFGMLELRFITFLNGENMGFGDLRALDPDLIYLEGSYAQGLPPAAPEGTKPLDIILINYIRDRPGGREIRHRFWMGMKFENGRFMSTLAPGARIPEEQARLMGRHCAGEYGTEVRNTLDFWKESRG